MELLVKRIYETREETLGVLYLNGKYKCWTLEDQRQEAGKVAGETRIPNGEYKIKLRQGSPMAKRYDSRFGDINHDGMLEVADVPNFSAILIHIGNDDDDTAGCLLVGEGWNKNMYAPSLLQSTVAYKLLYPRVRGALDKGEPVHITYVTERL